MEHALAATLRNFVPGAPPPAGAHIERAGVEGMRPWSFVDRLRLLISSGARSRFLLHGSIGVGKSTELARCAAALEPDCDVVLCTVTPGRSAKEAALSILAAIESSLSERAPSLGERANGESTLSRWGRVAGERPRCLLVDGLDLVPDARIAEYFGVSTPLLNDELPTTVFVAPHTLAQSSRHDRDPGFDSLVHLPPYPVVTSNRGVNEPVIQWLAAGLLRRFPDPEVLADTEVLRTIVYLSGGIPRDAVRLVREAVLAAASGGKLALPQLLEAERELRQDLEQALRGDDLYDLERLLSLNVMPDDTRRLLLTGALVLYEDALGERYWLPHPVLWRRLRNERSLRLV